MKLNTKQGTAKDRTHLFIIIKYIKKKLKKKKVELAGEKKMSKAIEENKLTVVIKGLRSEFDLSCKFMCTNFILCDMIRTKRPYPPSSTPVTVF